MTVERMLAEAAAQDVAIVCFLGAPASLVPARLPVQLRGSARRRSCPRADPDRREAPRRAV